MSKPFRIGFDMDGVIIDHTESKLVMAKVFNLELKPEDTPSQIMRKSIPPEIWERLEAMLFYDPEYAFISKPMEGAIQVLESLKQMSIDIFLISRRKHSNVAVDFLKFRGLWPHFFDKHNTAFVLKPEEKNKYAQAFKLTHYTDDEPQVLETLTDVSRRILFDQYGIFKESDKYIKISSWKEADKAFNFHI